MRKNVFHSLTLLAVVAGLNAHSAYAEQFGTSVAAPASAKDSDTARLDPTVFVQGRYSLYDSTRKTNFDFLSQTFRLGAHYSQGVFFAAGEAEFEGNVNGQSPTDNSSTLIGGGAVGVRQAYVGVNVYNTDTATVGVTLGRFLPHGATSYGADALTGQFGLSGFLPSDGVMVGYQGNLGFGAMTAQFAVVNNLPLFLYQSGPTGSQTTTNPAALGAKNWAFPMSGSAANMAAGNGFNTTSSTGHKAYLANVTAEMDAGPGKIEAAVAAGMQNNAVASTTIAATSTTPVVPASARDVGYVETSVGYNYLNTLKAGAWFSYADLSEVRYLADTNGGAQSFGPRTNGTKDQFYQYGFGGKGNSKYLGMSNMFAKDDAVTAAFGVQQFMHRQCGSTDGNALSQAEAQKNDVTQISLGGGYEKGPMNLELNYSYFVSAGANIFLNQGQNAYATSAHLIYLAATYQM